MVKGVRGVVVEGVDCSPCRSVGVALAGVVLQLRPGERLVVEALPTALHLSVVIPTDRDGLVVSCGGLGVTDTEREGRASKPVVEAFCGNLWRLLVALGAVTQAARATRPAGGPDVPAIVGKSARG